MIIWALRCGQPARGNSVKGDISIRFIKVKGHSGIEGNEEADQLAKEAVGICL